jgi:tetratricopeptide (TPR) repeat protein
LAQAYSFCDWDWSNAEREFRRALELNPRYVQGLSRYGIWYLQAVRGRFQEGYAHAQQAVELDPLSGWATTNLALAYAKPTDSRDARRASEPRSPALAGEEAQPGDPGLAHAFDVIVWNVRNVAIEANPTERRRPTQELAEQATAGKRQAANIVHQLQAAQKLAEDTRREIEKRVKEMCRQVRRATAAQNTKSCCGR